MRLPGVCQDCRQPVHWNGFRWINSQRNGAPHRPGAGQRHVCRRRCGAWMPQAGDRCGRKPNHLGYCRSRYAMDNERVAKSGRRAA